jgi:hypothetical protein
MMPKRINTEDAFSNLVLLKTHRSQVIQRHYLDYLFIQELEGQQKHKKNDRLIAVVSDNELQYSSKKPSSKREHHKGKDLSLF